MTVTETPVDQLAILDAKIDALTDHVAALTRDAEHRARQRAMLEELTGDVNAFSGDAMAKLTEVMAEADRRGYFEFARAGAGVVDRVVTNFDEDDVDRLGDNIVAILDAIREITQPEILALLGRMVEAVRAEQALVADEVDEPPPSLFALARQLRDPDVRRGMGRALHTLRAVSAPAGPTSNRSDTPHTPISKGDQQ